MKALRQIFLISVFAVFSIAVSLIFAISAHALPFDAAMGISDSFRTSWTNTHPNLATVTQIEFKTTGQNFYLDPTGVVGQFAWNGMGSQPDYTMDPDGSVTQYVGHIGGSSSILSIGNQTFDPNGNGKDFLTWYVDVPSLGKTDLLHFDLVSEQVLAGRTSANLSIYLLGYTWDQDGHWSSSLSSINLTVSQTGGAYSWAATWASPPFPTTPEPASVLLLGSGLGFAALTRRTLRRRKS